MTMYEDSNKLHLSLVVRHQTIMMNQIDNSDMKSIHLDF